ncbi:MAG: hypothetical protein FJ272_18365, partial [Planctomycetes bacterium]|nr:hypothetical protein [Planctomycetota bacterium]
AVFTARVNGLAATEVRRVRQKKQPSELPEGVTLLVFDVRVQDLSSWYNGYTYLDTLSHAAVRQFMKVTHEAYRQHCGKAFGKRVPGIFTDEPNYLPHTARIGGAVIAPWTEKLPETFLKRYGYDLIPKLPEVFFDLDGKAITPTRHDFYDCVTHLFVDAFGRQIGEWCKKNRMLHTGHLLLEDTLSAQTSVVGNCMRFYEYMQAPGIDLLTETRRIYDTAKQVSSAARQFGWKWRLTETYGVTRWDFPFTGHKALGDWQAALGMNLRCHHLTWYTAAGEAKRDYPASMNYQSPWWQVYAHVEDYYARLNVLLSRGQEVRDLLVVHPIESIWTLFRRDMGPNPEMQAYDQMLPRLRDELLWQHIDFDYGDEELLSRHGKAQRKGGKPVLRMAKAEYRAVLVPPLRTIRRATLDLLTEFAKLGGKVVFAGDPPKHVDCRPSDDAVNFAAQCVRTPAQGREMADAVAAECRRVAILDEKDAAVEAALYQLREDVDAFYLFICNTGMTAEQLRQNSLVNPPVAELKAEFPTVRVRGFAECEGAPQEWDALDGKRYAAVARRLDSGQWEIQTSLPRLGSRLFVIPKRPAESLASRQWDAQTSLRRLGSRLPVAPKKPAV